MPRGEFPARPLPAVHQSGSTAAGNYFMLWGITRAPAGNPFPVETGRKEVQLSVVKGFSRRVIVVRSPDPRLFDQAIFLMKEDAFHQEGVTAEQVVEEARRVASGYVRRAERKEGRVPWQERIPRWGWALIGMACSSALWGLLTLFL